MASATKSNGSEDVRVDRNVNEKPEDSHAAGEQSENSSRTDSKSCGDVNERGGGDAISQNPQVPAPELMNPDEADTEGTDDSSQNKDKEDEKCLVSSAENNKNLKLSQDNSTESDMDPHNGNLLKDKNTEDVGAEKSSELRHEDGVRSSPTNVVTDGIRQRMRREDDGAGAEEEEQVAPRAEGQYAGVAALLRNSIFLATVFLAIVLVFLATHWFGASSSPHPGQSKKSIDIFNEEMDKVRSSFPRQRADFWKRSKIHLSRHFQADEHTEPVSVILTSGRRAEKTLRCVALHVASALSSALNASVVQIDGAGKASLDSDQVKLDIDGELTGAFAGHRGVAVIHRFEELPPGSTLIFYRYCDHENAAFKEASLIFTVLLEEEDELEAHVNFSEVEEMVQDHIKDRFLSSTQPATYDRMDLDKFSGLWSRISHLILPVAAEDHVELQGCKL